MPAYCEPLANKRITLMGLGRLGRGLGDARFLADCGAQLTVTDLKTEDELADSLEQLKEYDNITFVLGEHREEDFTDTDLVVQAPATPLDSSYIAAAKASGVPVTMSAALAATYALNHGVIVVGVTGTRGKSTVTTMIYHTLVHAGVPAHLGGNTRGVSTLQLLPELSEGDVLVLELDSWQLQGFGYEFISPTIAVFTNFMEDHLNYYPDMQTYFSDKMNIARFQQDGDTLIVGASVNGQIAAENPPAAPVVPEALPEDWQLRVVGDHNRENAALAAAALRALGIEAGDIRRGLESFTGVEGRLQLMENTGALTIYNDNNATTPTATIAALNALRDDRPILIAGGADKGLPTGELAQMIADTCADVYLLNGTGTVHLKEHLPNAHYYDDFAALVTAALDAAQPDGTVLFSPAFASFGHFKNEYERNDMFTQLVAQYGN